MQVQGEAIVRKIQEGLDRMTFNINAAAAPVAARAGAGTGPINIVINVNGGGQAAEVGRASEGGVLAALRQGGLT